MCSGVLKNDCGCGTCNCTPCNDGVDGTNGASAYEIWIAEGNVGTEQDFLDSLTGATGNDGSDGIDGVMSPKASSYTEFSGQVSVKDGATPDVYHFPTGYGVNTFTNSTGSAKNYIVHGSYDTTLSGTNENDVENWVDGAIVKTVAAVDTVQWEHLGRIDFSGSLFDGATAGDTINQATTNKVLSDNSDAVEFRFGSMVFPSNVAFFKKLTLNDGESVSLKFKTKDASTPSLLEKAQFFVIEID